jgi:hypothetical protein
MHATTSLPRRARGFTLPAVSILPLAEEYALTVQAGAAALETRTGFIHACEIRQSLCAAHATTLMYSR